MCREDLSRMHSSWTRPRLRLWFLAQVSGCHKAIIITRCQCCQSGHAVCWLRQTAWSDARLNTVLQQARCRCHSLLSCVASYTTTVVTGCDDQTRNTKTKYIKIKLYYHSKKINVLVNEPNSMRVRACPPTPPLSDPSGHPWVFNLGLSTVAQ